MVHEKTIASNTPHPHHPSHQQMSRITHTSSQVGIHPIQLTITFPQTWPPTAHKPSPLPRLRLPIRLPIRLPHITHPTATTLTLMAVRPTTKGLHTPPTPRPTTILNIRTATSFLKTLIPLLEDPCLPLRISLSLLAPLKTWGLHLIAESGMPGKLRLPGILSAALPPERICCKTSMDNTASGLSFKISVSGLKAGSG